MRHLKERNYCVISEILDQDVNNEVQFQLSEKLSFFKSKRSTLQPTYFKCFLQFTICKNNFNWAIHIKKTAQYQGRKQPRSCFANSSEQCIRHVYMNFTQLHQVLTRVSLELKKEDAKMYVADLKYPFSYKSQYFIQPASRS